MPYVNRFGNVAHGKGGVGAYHNNVQFDTGGGANWLDKALNTTIVYQHEGGDGTYVGLYEIATGAKTRAITDTSSPFYGVGVNIIYGDGGIWAGFNTAVGVFTPTGLHLPNAGLLGVGPGGEIAYVPSYQSGVGATVRERNGEEWQLSDYVVYNLQLVGSGKAIWTESPSAVRVIGLPEPQKLSGGIYFPKVLQLHGDWWFCYYSDTKGVVLHPFDSLVGYTIVPLGQDAWIDMAATSAEVIRVVWSITEGEGAGHIQQVDINVVTDVRKNLSTGVTVSPPATGYPPGSTGTGSGGDVGGGITGGTTILLTSSASFNVVGAAEELITLPIEVYPSFPTGYGHGRIIHPTLGAFDYEVKPDEWVNIDADAIIAPIWASTRTMTSAANVLWEGNLRDVTVEERWKALGGLAMPMTQLRMLLAIWTTPMDPDVGYVQWYPTYITNVAFKVLPVALTAGGQGITFDDVANYLDDDGEPIGWMTNPVTLTMKLVERL